MLNAAYQAASPGDVVRIMSGTYVDQSMPTEVCCRRRRSSCSPRRRGGRRGQGVRSHRLLVDDQEHDCAAVRRPVDRTTRSSTSTTDSRQLTLDNVDLDGRINGVRQVRDGLGISGDTDYVTVKNSDLCCIQDQKLIQIQTYAHLDPKPAPDPVAEHDPRRLADRRQQAPGMPLARRDQRLPARRQPLLRLRTQRHPRQRRRRRHLRQLDDHQQRLRSRRHRRRRHPPGHRRLRRIPRKVELARRLQLHRPRACPHLLRRQPELAHHPRQHRRRRRLQLRQRRHLGIQHLGRSANAPAPTVAWAISRAAVTTLRPSPTARGDRATTGRRQLARRRSTRGIRRSGPQSTRTAHHAR